MSRRRASPDAPTAETPTAENTTPNTSGSDTPSKPQPTAPDSASPETTGTPPISSSQPPNSSATPSSSVEDRLSRAENLIARQNRMISGILEELQRHNQPATTPLQPAQPPLTAPTPGSPLTLEQLQQGTQTAGTLPQQFLQGILPKIQDKVINEIMGTGTSKQDADDLNLGRTIRSSLVNKYVNKSISRILQEAMTEETKSATIAETPATRGTPGDQPKTP